MAAKRGKSQARRNNGGGNDAIPAWAWLVLGVLLTVVVILVAPRFIKGDGDGFFRPQPNPDAQPVEVSGDEDVVAPEGPATESTARAASAVPAKGKDAEQDEEYDFYTLLPGKEVPLSDAELAATERAEAQRLASQRQAQAQTPVASTGTALPTPVDGNEDPTAAAPAPAPPAQAGPVNPTAAQPAAATTVAMTGSPKSPAATPTAPAGDTTRYLLQAGAFEASGQAEELKARIALLGLGARVESARISGKTVFRVRMGPYGSASDLAEAKRKLSAGGLPALAIKVQ